MKTIAILFLLLAGTTMAKLSKPQVKTEFERLLDAIAIVESGNNPSVIGDHGEAIGAYQLHKEYVDDVNRLLIKGATKYRYKDRLNIYHSKAMVVYYLLHYGKGKTIEQIAAIHCAGPNGWQQMEETKVKKYVQKVKAEMKKIK